MIEVLAGSDLSLKYIGKSEDIKRRRREHYRYLKNCKHENPRLQNFYNKYGKEALKFTHFMKCTINELNSWEKFFIKYFNSKNNGFNMTDGGDNPPIKTRRCVFKNILTDEIVEFDSIKEFQSKYGCPSASSVLNGRKSYTGEWYDPRREKPEFYSLVNEKGLEYKFLNASEFARKHGMKRNGVKKLIAGDVRFYKGWRLATSETRNKPFNIKDYPHPLMKKCELRNIKTGEIISCESQSEFILKYNLSEDSVTKLIYGRKKKIGCWENPNEPFKKDVK